MATQTSPATLPKHENPSIARARDLVLAHGWNSTSFQIVNPGISRWFSAAGDAVTGYVSAGGVRVVVGAPVCSGKRLLDVADEFETDAAARQEQVCYFAAESRLESTLGESADHSKFLIGAQPMWHPDEWDGIVSKNRSLRAQLNRARNKGVTVSEWMGGDAVDSPELKACLRDWLESKGLPPLHFMVESDTLARLENRRVFVAERSGGVVGFVVLSPVATRNGWLFEQFPHRPGSPNGTVELMIDAAMRALAADGAEYATLGLSPLSTRAPVEPFPNPLWLRVLLGWLRKHGRRFYNFDGLDAFKSKLRPMGWEPVFALSNEPRVSFKTLYAIAVAFSGNAPVRMILGGLGRSVMTEIRWMGRRLSGKTK
jgi:phosphatidylglycerol lysyltransferase